jgi:hypothetical protein
MKNRFKVTYETVTEESASNGDSAHRGFLPRSGNVPMDRDNMPKNPARFTLAQVLDMFQPAGSGPCEADSCPCTVPRWINCQTTQDWERPNVRLAVHLEEISDASARRVARLLRCYGLTASL